MSQHTEIHGSPAQTTVTEDVHDIVDHWRSFYSRNQQLVIFTGILGIALLLNRSMLRRELRRLQFTAEFFPYDMIDDEMFDAVSE